MSKLEQRTCLSRTSRIGGTVRDGLKACSSETSTAQYIIYNIKKWGCLIARVVQRKPTLLNVPWRFLFPPHPDQKKPSTTYPKRLPIRLPHHQCAADSLSRPHLWMTSTPWNSLLETVVRERNSGSYVDEVPLNRAYMISRQLQHAS